MAERIPHFHGETKLSPTQRQEFISGVKPHAQKAKDSYSTIRTFNALQQEECVIESLDQASKTDADTEILINWLDEIGEKRAKLGGENAHKTAQQTWKSATDEIVLHVTTLRETPKIDTSSKDTMATSGKRAIQQPLTSEENDQRLKFIASVKNPAFKARSAHRIHKEIRHLEGAYQELTDQYAASNRDLFAPDVIAILEKRKDVSDKLAELGGKERKKTVFDEFRKQTNEVIRKTNQLKVEKRIQKGSIYPEAGNLIGRQQIPFIRETMAQREADSPGLPHNDLGELAIYKDQYLNGILLAEIKAASREKWPENPRMADTAIAVARVLSRHMVEGGYNSTPLPFRNIGEITKGILNTVDLVLQYKAQTLQYPSPEDFAVRNKDQKEHIQRFVQVTMVDFLYQELTNPHLNENQIRQLYQTMCNQLRHAAELIGGSERFEMVAKAIEELDPIEHALTVSRLSNNLNFDFGFVGGDIASERRFAEALRDTSYQIERERKKLDSKLRGNTTPYDLPGEHILAKVIEALEDRMEAGDIDLEAIAKDLNSVGYTPKIIKMLWQYTSADERDILMQFFSQTSNLRSLIPDDEENE